MVSNRLQNSAKNIIAGFTSRIVVLLLGLVVRTVFIWKLGNAYLSINGLYSNILNMLSLAELGFGTAVVYSMYKPIADSNREKLKSLMALYKKVYRVVGWVVFAVGISIIPFMDYIIKDPPNIPYLNFYYILFLLNSSMSYWFWGYRKSILIADQKEYIASGIHVASNIGKSILQIAVLFLIRNFTAYLLVQILLTIAENLCISMIVKKKYVFLEERTVAKLDKSENKSIWVNVKALALSRLGHVILNSTDSIIISAIVGVSSVGILSNYMLIVEALTSVFCQITSALSASLGNYFATESRDKGYILFKRIQFVNSWLYGSAAICLLILLNPFIELWVGQEFLFDMPVVAVIVLNFYIQGFMNTLWTFRTTLGLFKQGWVRPLIVAIVNIVASLILGYFWGVIGVLFATFVARASVNLWYDPWIIHKYGFGRSVKPFIKWCAITIGELCAIFIVAMVAKMLIMHLELTIWTFIILAFVTLGIIVGMFFLLSHRRDEYHYLINIVKQKVSTHRSRKA